jgi:tRNA(fMet)-specific endonuclease VapC
VEEVLRGLISHVGRQRDETRRIEWYRRLHIAIQSRSKRRTPLWNDAAVNEFQVLNSQRIRIGTMDLRIASIVIANGATLLTRNLKDFARVPGLRVENWLE